jgi:hypothetical protein
MTTVPEHTVRRKFGLPEVAIVLAIAALLSFLVFGFVESQRKSTLRVVDRLKVIDIQALMVAWNNDMGHLPPAQVRSPKEELPHAWHKDQLPYSWRSALLGTSGDSCFPTGTEPEPEDFIDPTRSGRLARFAAITGPGTAFDADKAPISLGALPAHTILFVEIRNCPKDYFQPGGDLDIRTMDHTVGQGTGNDPSGVYPAGFWVGFADREAWYLSHDVPFDTLSHFFTLESASRHNREIELGKYLLYTAAIR